MDYNEWLILDEHASCCGITVVLSDDWGFDGPTFDLNEASQYLLDMTCAETLFQAVVVSNFSKKFIAVIADADRSERIKKSEKAFEDVLIQCWFKMTNQWINGNTGNELCMYTLIGK